METETQNHLDMETLCLHVRCDLSAADADSEIILAQIETADGGTPYVLVYDPTPEPLPDNPDKSPDFYLAQYSATLGDILTDSRNYDGSEELGWELSGDFVCMISRSETRSYAISVEFKDSNNYGVTKDFWLTNMRTGARDSAAEQPFSLVECESEFADVTVLTESEFRHYDFTATEPATEAATEAATAMTEASTIVFTAPAPTAPAGQQDAGLPMVLVIGAAVGILALTAVTFGIVSAVRKHKESREQRRTHKPHKPQTGKHPEASDNPDDQKKTAGQGDINIPVRDYMGYDARSQNQDQKKPVDSGSISNDDSEDTTLSSVDENDSENTTFSPDDENDFNDDHSEDTTLSSVDENPLDRTNVLKEEAQKKKEQKPSDVFVQETEISCNSAMSPELKRIFSLPTAQQLEELKERGAAYYDIMVFDAKLKPMREDYQYASVFVRIGKELCVNPLMEAQVRRERILENRQKLSKHFEIRPSGEHIPAIVNEQNVNQVEYKGVIVLEEQ